MKKLVTIGILGFVIFLISNQMAYPQSEKEVLQKKQAQAEIAADSDRYILGSEDILYIHVWKEEQFSKTVPVRIDGKISLPLMDEIQAAGQTPLQLKELLTQKLKEFVENPMVTVMVMEANSFQVYISGEIRKPGAYRLKTETSLLQFIPLAGGFTEWANQKKILIIRKEDGKEKRIIINYKKILKGEDPKANIILKSGDTIIVPD
jgi:polysaccharide export outer membrane protein